MTAAAPAAAPPVDLLQHSEWNFRIVKPGKTPGIWTPDLRGLVQRLYPEIRNVYLPQVWYAFGGGGDVHSIHRCPQCPAVLRQAGPLPQVLQFQGEAFRLQRLKQDQTGYLSLADVFGHGGPCGCAFVFGDFWMDRDDEFHLYAGADWWMEWWLDGEPLGDTLEQGNKTLPLRKPHLFQRKLQAGPHRLAGRILSGTSGWGLVCEATQGSRTPAKLAPGARVEGRRGFQVARPSDFVSLTLVGGGESPSRVNGHSLKAEIPGLEVEDWFGVPPSVLVSGENELTRVWEGEESLSSLLPARLAFFQADAENRSLRLEQALLGIPPGGVTLRGAPVPGWAGTASIRLTCQTNAAVPLRLRCAGQESVSPPGCFHHFQLKNLPPDARLPYALETPEGHRVGEGTARTLPENGELTLLVLGDPSPSPKAFARVAASIRDPLPDVILWLGDLTTNGLRAAAWEEEFFSRAPHLFPNVSHLAIPGNHERQTPLWEKWFPNPGGQKHWIFKQGALTLIGIDGQGDWSPGSTNHTWLEQALAEAATPFVLLANHYPAFSSSGHGQLDADGLPMETPVRNARLSILPLAARHGVRAILNGHEHGYERSLLPGNITQIIAAGAGGRIYPPSDAAGLQNPHRLVHAATHHTVTFRLSRTTLKLEARDLQGEVLDTVEWSG